MNERPLTPRQLQLVILLARGHTYKESASTMGVSLSTISNLLLKPDYGVHSRLGCSTQNFLTHWAIAHDLVEAGDCVRWNGRGDPR